jgi:hypothetical protein
VPGLYFLGLLFQHSNRSSLFWGVAEDASYVAGQIEGVSGPAKAG